MFASAAEVLFFYFGINLVTENNFNVQCNIIVSVHLFIKMFEDKPIQFSQIEPTDWNRRRQVVKYLYQL